MSKLVKESWTDPRIFEGAAAVVPVNYNRENPTSYGRAIEQWIRAHVTIVDEPFERIMAPGLLVDQARRGRAIGDCDDVATLAAALLTTLGVPARFVAIREPGWPVFQHVYVEYETPAGWATLDPTLDELPPGVFDRMIEPVLGYA